MTDLFPIELPAQETPHYTESDHEFRSTFIAAKPEGMSWYAYDVEVKSPTLVRFTAYGMRDSCYGGIGEARGSFEVTVAPEVTREAIEREAMRLAKARRRAELRAEEDARIKAYAGEILAEVYGARGSEVPQELDRKA
jgi:hypothetical protein